MAVIGEMPPAREKASTLAVADEVEKSDRMGKVDLSLLVASPSRLERKPANAQPDIAPTGPSAEPSSVIRKPAMRLSAPRPDYGRFRSLQAWEGFIEDVEGSTFTCVLRSLQHEESEERASVPIEEISPKDRGRIVPGAIFYWAIGYIDRPTGQRQRASIIWFRPRPTATRAALDAARREALAMKREIAPDCL